MAKENARRVESILDFITTQLIIAETQNRMYMLSFINYAYLRSMLTVKVALDELSRTSFSFALK